jgi:histidyl-tRNA synthetase
MSRADCISAFFPGCGPVNQLESFLTEEEKGVSAPIQPPRGTVDILPADTAKWQQLESTLRSVLHRANYKEIRLPIFEHTELFKRGVGETTDIVNKEMYTFEDKSQRSLTLRPEGTAGVVRAYMSHGLSRQTPPQKLWYCGPMFRYERPQTGRQRQFHQTGVEVFGSEGPAVDAEVIVMAVDCMVALGITNFDVHLNSIGCVVCRPVFREKLKEAIQPHLAELCDDCKDRFERNPLRMLDCKNTDCQKFYKDLPSPLQHLCENCRPHWDELLRLLEKVGVKTVINERLVRGLDYYGRTVFELITDDSRLGAQSTILAGGRYDYLVESLGGPPTPAVGWACGMERLTLLLDGVTTTNPKVFVINENAEAAFETVTRIRRLNIACEMDYPLTGTAMRPIKRQFQQADKVGAELALLMADGSIVAKNLKDGTQKDVSSEQLVQFLQEIAGKSV